MNNISRPCIEVPKPKNIKLSDKLSLAERNNLEAFCHAMEHSTLALVRKSMTICKASSDIVNFQAIAQYPYGK